MREILTLDTAYRFCEDAAASVPVDLAQPPLTGPLGGRVIGVKSNIRVAGQAWTAGIGARAGQIAQRDAPLIAQLRRAGALILGRLAMDEGALGAATDNPHFGRCENPAHPGHSAGGSSGGSAAAVAAGAVDAALGSDTMGSVRIPAAYCGVYGLKTGAQALDMEGVFPLAPSLDAPGLFARTPQMMKEVLGHLACTLAPHAQIDGWITCAPAALTGCHPDVSAFHNAAHRALQELLGRPMVMEPVDFAGLRGDAFLLTEVEAVASLGDEEGLSPGLRKLIAYGRNLSPETLGAAQERLARARAALRQALGGSRVLLLPCVAQPAFAQGARAPAGQADFTALANIADLPAISVPRRGAHPPVAIQLVGPPGSERALVDLAQHIAATA